MTEADIYYLHRMGSAPVEQVAEAMGRLIDEGLIRGWGLSQVDVDVIDRAQKVTPLSAIQNMTDADLDTMRELVSEDMVFTHMSGKQQTRDEYFADVEDGSLDYYTIGISNPEITVNGSKAQITYTAILNACGH